MPSSVDKGRERGREREEERDGPENYGMLFFYFCIKACYLAKLNSEMDSTSFDLSNNPIIPIM